MTIKAIDAIRKRIDDLEAKLSDSLVAVVVANQGNQKATLHFGDPTHTISDIPSVSSYYPTPGQSVRVQRSGDTLLILGATTFIEPIVSNDEQPTTGYPGQLWSDAEGNLFRWENGAWVPVNAADPTARDDAGSKNRIYMQDDMPLDSPVGTIQDGDTWYDTNDGNKLYVWQGGSWTIAQDTNIPAVVVVANNALTSANGKNKNYYQTSAPTGGTYIDGDLWFDTDDGNKPYTRQGSSWVSVQDATIAANLSTALTAANGKSKNYYQSSTPTGGTYQVGDTWFNTASDNAISRWNGTSWAAAPLGMNALGTLTITNAMLAGSIDAGKITTGTLNASNVTITNLSVTNSMIVSGLDAGKITTGTLAADRITAGNLNIQSGTLSIYRSSGDSSTDAVYISNGRLNVNNDIFAGGNLYGGSTSTGPICNAGLTVYSPSHNNNADALTVESGYIVVPNQPTASGSTVLWNSGAGRYVTTSSGREKKKFIKNVSSPELDPKGLLSLPVREFQYRTGIIMEGDEDENRKLIGFIADEVETYFPVGATHDAEGKPRDWDFRKVVPGLLALIQQQEKRIQQLEGKQNGK